MLTYENALDPFNFLLRGRNGEHVVKVFLLLFNDHLDIVRYVVVVNALPFVLSTILIRIVVGRRHLFSAFIVGLDRILCLFVTVLCQGKFVGFWGYGNGFPLD